MKYEQNAEDLPREKRTPNELREKTAEPRAQANRTGTNDLQTQDQVQNQQTAKAIRIEKRLNLVRKHTGRPSEDLQTQDQTST